MNRKPFLFISHSAKEEPAEKLLKKLEKGLERSGWDVFVDRTRLQPGALWREQLHSALAVCDAAVILFSRAAYEDSVWVLKEATIFDWRASLDPARSFPIVPILFDVAREELGADRFKALALAQRVPVYANARNVVAQVRKALGTPKSGSGPLERIQHAIAVRLKNIDVRDLQAASVHLGETLPWGPALEVRERFARDLFHADFHTIRKVLIEIATFLDAAAIREIINLLAPFTVDPVAVAPIPKVALQLPPRDHAAFAINSRSQETGDRYIQRARCHTDPWTVYHLANAGGHDQAGSLIAELFRAIRDQSVDVGSYSDHELLELLDSELREGDPVFVLIHGPVERTAVDALRMQFPSCTFLVLAGTDCDVERLRTANVKLLTPLMDPHREKTIAQHILMARQIAARRERQSA